MRVLVDTSAWADFLNGFPSPVADALADLLRGDDDVCTRGIVVAEVFQGLRRAEGRLAIRRSFEELTFLEPSDIRLYLRGAELADPPAAEAVELPYGGHDHRSSQLRGCQRVA